MLERIFRLKENGTTVGREITAGATTFMTLSYIIFVQPVILSAAGMDKGAVMVATCISSAIATIIMAFYANYPIALAPAMGHNFYFAFTVCGAVAVGGYGYSWQVALGAVFVSGVIFITLSFFGFRELIVNIIPESVKYGIAVGIGLLIAVLGLTWSGLVSYSPGTMASPGDITSPPALLFLFGLGLIIVLYLFRAPGSIMIGMIGTALLGFATGLVRYYGVVALPPSIAPTLFQLDITGVFLSVDFLSIVFVFFFLDLFDTVGTLVGVSEQAGFLREGKLPRARQALFSDAVGTVSGSLFGTSTVTSYIESAAGVAVGGRTGLANITTAFLLLSSLFFYPVVRMVGGGYQLAKDVTLYPVIAPALIMVGFFMMKGIRKVNWRDVTEAVPALLTMVAMPLTFSITEGIALGFISLALLKLFSKRKRRELHWLIYLFAALFLLRYILIPQARWFFKFL
jgi:AGZA family xanthine/uracil permease-like MFS transporter